jgi:hypothetical protein
LPLSRRDLLRLGGIAPFGLAWSGLPKAEGAVGAGSKPIRACIFIFYYGGPSHLDTFDPKPDAPAEVRGEFATIATTVPSLRIGEHLPAMARVMHKVAVIRGMHHPMRNHDSACAEALTGRAPAGGDAENFAPPPTAQVFPGIGAALSYLWRERRLKVPHAALPFPIRNVVPVPGQGGGFLGGGYDPFLILGDHATLGYRAEALQLPEGLARGRLDRRRSLLDAVSGTPLGALYARAFDLLDSDAVRRALEVEREDPKIRDRYGRALRRGRDDCDPKSPGPEKAAERDLRGQSLLVARRLVEAGVPFVSVYDYRQQGPNWDTHAANFERLRDHLLPAADRALAALVEDLDARGLLESTLVVATGEFGRTPRVNKQAGRDHWPDCYSLVLAGGGVRGGAVHGSSDKLGAYPASDPVTPGDLVATILWRFGLDPSAEIRDPTGRPFRVAEGRPLRELFACRDRCPSDPP